MTTKAGKLKKLIEAERKLREEISKKAKENKEKPTNEGVNESKEESQ